jgi:molecular chaperone GrpE (heat shock protein)
MQVVKDPPPEILPLEKDSKSYSSSLLMIAVFLFILFNVVFKIGRSPKPTIKLRPFPKKKPSPPSSEETSKPLTSQNRPEVKAHSSDFESHLSNQTESIKSLRNDLSTLIKTINDMSQTFMALKTNLDQKDEEISRYKDGYDATIFKNFLLRFTRVDKVIKEYLADNKIDINGLKDIQIQMDDALAECDVEVFSPKIGANFKSAIGVADNPEIRETSDKSQDSTIAEILMPGYHRKLPSNVNDDDQIIIEAKVVIYVYKK